MQPQDLEQMVYKELEGQRYLIVLDDMWKTKIWDHCLVRAFPDAANGSRLLLTTRHRDVPLHMDPLSIPYELKLLDQGDSWQLLLKKVFGDSNNPKCSSELESTGREIARRCAGLPLAITVIGGLLATKKKLKSEWERVLSNIKVHFSRSDSQVSAILALSYFDLPSHLKSCFLYFGLFPEDREIDARKLIRLWVAEGFIKQEGTESLEMIAVDRLEELINRNMVQVAKLTIDERIKSCRMHDVLRELAIAKAKEENFLEIYDPGARDVRRAAQSRYLADHSECEYSDLFKDARPHLRSLLLLSSSNPLFKQPLHNRISDCLKDFRLLRVADLEREDIFSLRKDVDELCLLRYLSIRWTRLNKIPSSLCYLHSLQTLDLRSFETVEVPNMIWKLENLRHLFLYRIKCNVPLKFEGLKNLRTLSRIHCDHLVPNNLKTLTSLSELGVWVEENSELDKLFMSLAELKELHFLRLYQFESSQIPSLARLSALHALTELKLTGRLQMLPEPNHFPSNLSHLTLVDSHLEEDPMATLEKLTMLSFLRLKGKCFGKKLKISGNGFPRLKFLDLDQLSELDEIMVTKGAMPELKSLRIRRCPCFEMLPEELLCMTGLKKVKIMDMSMSFSYGLEELYKVGRIVKIIDSEETRRLKKEELEMLE